MERDGSHIHLTWPLSFTIASPSYRPNAVLLYRFKNFARCLTYLFFYRYRFLWSYCLYCLKRFIVLMIFWEGRQLLLYIHILPNNVQILFICSDQDLRFAKCFSYSLILLYATWAAWYSQNATHYEGVAFGRGYDCFSTFMCSL